MNNISRREFLAGTGAALLMGCVPGSPRRLPRASERRRNKGPNFIFLLTDDQGWGDSKTFGHPYLQTPNLDRIAREGAWFQQFYVNGPVCSPSRTAFMTGNYPSRYRVHQHFATSKQNEERDMPNWLDPDAITACDVLGSAGYGTAHFGKWHLGSGQGAPGPDAYGIEDSRTINSSGPSWDEKSDPFFRAHSSGLFVDETMRFIRSCEAQNRPFYVNLWTLVPHAPLKPTPEEMAAYQDLEVQPDDFMGYMPDYVRNAKDPVAQMKVFCAAVTGLDKAIGRLLALLDGEGLAEDTVLIFSSDNGPEDYHIGNAANAGMGSPGPLRGRKRSLYEGGIRTPFLVRWPGHVRAGRRDDRSVVTGVDFLPTLGRLAGAKVPDMHLDGEDVSDILLRGPRPRIKDIYWEWRGNVAGDPVYRPPCLAIREGDWKFLMNQDGSEPELFCIPKDPEEREDLAPQCPDIAKRLSAKLLDWKAGLPG